MTNDIGSSSRAIVDLSRRAAVTGRMGVAVSGLVAQWLRGLTINAHERLALSHLWEHGPMTMSELGSRIPLSRAAVTALTDRLEALSYVQRTPDAHDRRRTVLSLTARPERLIAGFIEEWTAEIAQLEERFSAEELRVIERWNESLRDISHRQAETLRRRGDDELPTAAPAR